MSAPIVFTIPGEARAWARARVRVIPGHGVRHFMDNNTRSYESLVKMAAEGAMRGRDPLQEPLAMSILIRKQPPKSASGVKTRAMLAGELRPGVKPDLSNLAKGIEDALNGIAYRDDAQIVDLRVAKIYSREAGVDVLIKLWVRHMEEAI